MVKENLGFEFAAARQVLTSVAGSGGMSAMEPVGGRSAEGAQADQDHPGLSAAQCGRRGESRPQEPAQGQCLVAGKAPA